MLVALGAFLLVFALVVFVHEFGHYLAARRAGVPVYEFCLGFPIGPRLCTLFQYKETAFTIRLLPLGGFVSFNQDHEHSTNALQTASLGQRALILSAGSACNIGFAFGIMVLVSITTQGLSLPTALDRSAAVIWLVVVSTGDALWGLLTGQGNMDHLMGMVGIAHLAGEAAHYGVASLLYFSGLLSLSLGLMNLLPLPALDGGQLLLLFIEGVRRKPLTTQTIQAVNLFGFVGLLLLSIFVTYRDLITLWT